MNLFANETEELLKKHMSEDWAEILSRYIDVTTFDSIRNEVIKARKTAIVYPEPKDVFNALKYPYKDIKVVIVGQDPYFNGNADGLAFSCKHSLSPSLSQILNAIHVDGMKSLGNPNPTQFNMNYYKGNMNNWNLEYLSNQGVLLYNPSLTVEENKPNSHRLIWREFSKGIFKALSTRKELVWMVWGASAKDAVASIFPLEKHYLLINEHPAAAARDNRVWKCNHFSETNKWLKEKGMEEIKWLK